MITLSQNKLILEQSRQDSELEPSKQKIFFLGNGRKAAKKLIMIKFVYCSTVHVAFWSIENVTCKGIAHV
jgi:hypothetical protein